MLTAFHFAFALAVCCSASAAPNDCSNVLIPDTKISLHESHLAMAVLKKLNKENYETYGKAAGAKIPFGNMIVGGTYEQNSSNISKLSDYFSFNMTHDEASGILETSLSKTVVDGFVKCKQAEAIAIWLTNRSPDSVILNFFWNAPGDAPAQSKIRFNISGGYREKNNPASSQFDESVGHKTARSIIIYRELGMPLKIVANQANNSDAVSLPGKVRRLKLMDTKAFSVEKYPVTASHGGEALEGTIAKPDVGYILLTETLQAHFDCKEGDPRQNCHKMSSSWIENPTPWIIALKGRAYPTTAKGTYLKIWSTGIQQKYEYIEENF